MSRRTILLILLLSILLVACSSAQEPEATSEPIEEIPDTPLPTLPALLPAPTRDEAYPAPTAAGGYPGPDEPAGIPTATPSDGYPAPPAPLPTFDPYPGGVAVVVIAAGIQCEDPLFTNLEEALATLEESGLTVLSAEEEELLVCTACNCPTSLHYKVTIPPDELAAALALGWQRR
jgi:hypothetical protein